MTETTARPIAGRTIGDYAAAAGSAAPMPGGGSVSGVVGALAAALAQMVANVSAKHADDPRFAEQAATLQTRVDAFLNGAEADEAAYGGYIATTRLPKSTAEEKTARTQAVQAALRESAFAPLAIARNAANLLDDLTPVIELGAKNILSDAEVAIIFGEAAVCGALVNVRANLPWLKDDALVAELTEAIADTESRARIAAELARQTLAARNA
ncbi:MAG: cyclodeaminase/cyclohydrolase family protein [Thermomicrobiales bacterium]